MTGHEERLITEYKDGMKPLNNHIIVKVDFDPEEDRTEGGLFKGNGTWDEAGHVARYGTVVSVCSRLYEREVHRFGIEWGTEIDVKEGDTVYFGKMAGYDSPILTKGDEMFFVVDYSEVILRIRDGIYPLNGFVIVERVEEEKKSVLETSFSRKLNKRKGIVRYTGKQLDYYFPKYKGIVGAKGLNEGDKVLFSISAWTELEDSRYAKLDPKLGYIQDRWIAAII